EAIEPPISLKAQPFTNSNNFPPKTLAERRPISISKPPPRRQTATAHINNPSHPSRLIAGATATPPASKKDPQKHLRSAARFLRTHHTSYPLSNLVQPA